MLIPSPNPRFLHFMPVFFILLIVSSLLNGETIRFIVLYIHKLFLYWWHDLVGFQGHLNYQTEWSAEQKIICLSYSCQFTHNLRHCICQFRSHSILKIYAYRKVWHGTSIKLYQEPAKYQSILTASICRFTIRMVEVGGPNGNGHIRQRSNWSTKFTPWQSDTHRSDWTHIRSQNKWRNRRSKNFRVRKQGEITGWENKVLKAREKGVQTIPLDGTR